MPKDACLPCQTGTACVMSLPGQAGLLPDPGLTANLLQDVPAPPCRVLPATMKPSFVPLLRASACAEAFFMLFRTGRFLLALLVPAILVYFGPSPAHKECQLPRGFLLLPGHGHCLA